MMEFKDIIKKLRTEKNLSQAELASELGTSNSTVAMWEIGKRYPSKELYEQIADYFNVDMDYLYGRTNIRQKIHFDNDGTAMVPLSAFQARMMLYYDKLNALGKKEAEKRVYELTQIGIYIETQNAEEIEQQAKKRLLNYYDHLSTKTSCSFVAEESSYGVVAAHNAHSDEPGEQENMLDDINGLQKP